MLEQEICVHQTTVTNLNAMGNDIATNSSSPDAALLKERLNSLNRRWRSVCTEVSERKERCVAC